MAIQHRRGVYADFDPLKAVDAEVLVVQNGDPNTTDGEAVYMAIRPGVVKRLATSDEIEGKVIEAKDDLVEAVQAQVDSLDGIAEQVHAEVQEAAEIKDEIYDLFLEPSVDKPLSNALLGQGYGYCYTDAADTEKLVHLSPYNLSVGGIVTVLFFAFNVFILFKKKPKMDAPIENLDE